MSPQPKPGATHRTAIRRQPERAVADRGVGEAIIDSALIAHVAVVAEGQPYVLPVAIARDGNQVLFHGSTASRLFRALAAGAPTCLTITELDGLVLARSAFESSMNYRSVMVLGVAEALTGEAKDRALRVLTDHLTPGRWDHLRPMKRKESAATMVLSLSLDEMSVKVRAGGPEDEEDAGFPVWAGHVPLTRVSGEPVPAAPATTNPRGTT